MEVYYCLFARWKLPLFRICEMLFAINHNSVRHLLKRTAKCVFNGRDVWKKFFQTLRVKRVVGTATLQDTLAFVNGEIGPGKANVFFLCV